MRPGCRQPAYCFFALLALLHFSVPCFAQQDSTQTRYPSDQKAAGFVEILNSDASDDGVYWCEWEAFPGIFVIHFHEYELQGRTFNRIAMFVEMAGQRGKVPTAQEYEDCLSKANKSIGGMYGAHDYRLTDLADFYNQASNRGIELTHEELNLMDWLIEIGLFWTGEDNFPVRSTGDFAVLSFASNAGPDEPAMLGRPGKAWEACALYHETRHGLFFTRQEYAGTCWQFWDEKMTSAERRIAREMLGSLGYDPWDEDLMVNEWTAWLLTPNHTGIGPASMARSIRRIGKQMQHKGDSMSTMIWTELLSLADKLDSGAMSNELREVLGPEWDIPAFEEVLRLAGSSS